MTLGSTPYTQANFPRVFLDAEERLVQVLGAGTQDVEVARCTCDLRLREGAGVSLSSLCLERIGTPHGSLETQVLVRMGHFGDGHQLAEVTQAVVPNHAGAAPGSPVTLPSSYPTLRSCRSDLPPSGVVNSLVSLRGPSPLPLTTTISSL